MKYGLIALLVIILNGCAAAPGAHISSGNAEWYSDEQEAEEFDIEEQVVIYRITPSLIADLQGKVEPTPIFNAALEANIRQYDYIVDSGDVLNVTVWDHPELTIPAGPERSPQEAGNWVHQDGAIFYPYIGEVYVAGLQVTEIRDIIRRRLARYIESPQVDVTVAAFRSKRVYVTGEVEEPGTLPITNVPLTLLEAISRAGGLTDAADWTEVTLTRDGETREYSLRELYQNGNTNQNILLRSNDIVHVARNDAAKVFVLGEVEEPKTIAVGRADLTLAEALTQAGGFVQTTADASGIFVVRKAPVESGKVAVVYQLDARNATALVLADQFQLEQRDIVYVTAAPVGRWNRVISQLLPTAQIQSISRQ